MAPRYPSLLQINTRVWLTELAQRLGRPATLDDVPDRDLDGLANLGVDWIWLLSVWQTGAAAQRVSRSNPEWLAEFEHTLPDLREEDIAGSGFAITGYTVHRLIGGDAALARLRARLQQRGLRLMLDFVPNHMALDHPWIHSHPEYFVSGTEEDLRRAPQNYVRLADADGSQRVLAYGRDPYFSGWPDTLQLDYSNPGTHRAMAAELTRIAGQCDGVRCDMAMLVLNDVFDGTWRRVLGGAWPRLSPDFWRETTRLVPRLDYVAEVYWQLEARLLEQGFTFAYDKRLLDALHAPDAAPAVRDLLVSPTPEPSRLARFIENHDEPRSAATLTERLTAASSLIATSPGLRFFFDGQLDGRQIKSPVQLGRWADEPVDEQIRAMYRRMLRFARAPLLHEGNWRLLHVSAAGDHTFNDIIAYRWRSADALAVVAVNLGGSASQAHINLAADLPDSDAFDFVDALTDARYLRTRESLMASGLYVRLEAGSAHLFEVVPPG